MKKINIFDIFLVLILISVLVVGYVYMSGKTIVKDKETIEYSILVEDISLETASQIGVGETVYNSVNGKPIGVIKKINVSEYQEDFFDKNTGEYRKVVKIEHYSVEMVVETEAENRNGIYYTGDLKISIGTNAYLRGQNYVCHGRFMGVLEVIDSEK